MNYKFIGIEKRSYKLRLASAPFYDQVGRGAFDPEVIEPDIFIGFIYKERLRMT
jgi:hypothetical protein